jgi:hypothetical protein
MSGIITVVPASSGNSGASRPSHWTVPSSTPKPDALPIGVGVCGWGLYTAYGHSDATTTERNQVIDVIINKDRLVGPCHTMPPSEEGTKAVPFQRSLGAVFNHEAESRALR